MTQNERVRRYIAAHPWCTTMEIQLALEPFVSNPRARISDLRKAGHTIRLSKRPSDGREGYVDWPESSVTAGVQEAMAL